MNRLVEQFLFEVHDVTLSPRFNIAPSQPLAALRVVEDEGRRQLALLAWGLVPSWAKDRLIGNRLINARAETIREKPSFRTAFRRRRCLVLSDGYYEWKKAENATKKQPYYIRLQDERPFAFAGLWETWQPEDGPKLETCTIITTTANELTRPIHHRMPVILDASDYDAWLNTAESDLDNLQDRLSPYPSDAMTVFPVSTTVNNPRNESPDCIQPLDSTFPDDPIQRTLL